MTLTVALNGDQETSLVYSELTDITLFILLEVLHFSLIYPLKNTDVPVF
jgi:hypothetical protein